MRTIDTLRALTVATNSMRYNPEIDPDVASAYEQILVNLRDKLSQEMDNPPLTLEELREMDGETVYCISDWDAVVNGKDLHHFHEEGWGIVTGTDMGDQGFIVGTVYTYHLEHYGKTWTAYRRKPEEGRNES